MKETLQVMRMATQHVTGDSIEDVIISLGNASIKF